MTAYYNEIDPYAAQWLRNLIEAGHITPGVVDERDIRDIRPDELTGYTRVHLFAGIGVWDYALKLAEWPEDREVWTGSAPCQPFSAAGKRGGFADERHLWPSWFWLIAQCRPSIIFGEQVANALDWLDLVSADLEGEGYTVRATDTCAAGFGAPHIRQRLWWVADAEGGDGRLPVFGRRSRKDRPQPVGGGETCRVADYRGEGLAGWQEQPAREERSPTERSSAAGRVADSQVPERRGQGSPDLEGRGVEEVGRSGIVGGVADASCAERRAQPQGRGDVNDGPDTGREEAAGRHGMDSALGGFWSLCDWLPCRDGKARPVEPGTFPLAHGIANRVGRLRAYGNSLCAPAAEAFVMAYMALGGGQ